MAKKKPKKSGEPAFSETTIQDIESLMNAEYAALAQCFAQFAIVLRPDVDPAKAAQLVYDKLVGGGLSVDDCKDIGYQVSASWHEPPKNAN